MKCQWHRNECPDDATQVCDVPVVGDSMCFCDTHAGKSPDLDWYPLTPERAIQEEEADRATRKAIASIRVRRTP